VDKDDDMDDVIYDVMDDDIMMSWMMSWMMSYMMSYMISYKVQIIIIILNNYISYGCCFGNFIQRVAHTYKLTWFLLFIISMINII
jgi:hypothetical protein